MIVTGTHFNYYQICFRKLWLFANGINMEQESDLVYDGKVIHENSYPQRSAKYEEVSIAGIKVDFYDAKNKVIHEIKKSNKIEKAHEWQLKYYLYIFEKQGICCSHGVLEYPLLHKTQVVSLDDKDSKDIEYMIKHIELIVSQGKCPSHIKKAVCKNCSYNDFCYVNDKEEE